MRDPRKNINVIFNEKGEIDLEVTKNSPIYGRDRPSQGYIFGAIFRSISDKNRFFENRAKLIEIINNYREIYLKDIIK